MERVNAVAGNQKIVECEVVSAGHNVSWGSKRPASTLQMWSGEVIVPEFLQLGRSSAVAFTVLYKHPVCRSSLSTAVCVQKSKKPHCSLLAMGAAQDVVAAQTKHFLPNGLLGKGEDRRGLAHQSADQQNRLCLAVVGEEAEVTIFMKRYGNT